MLAMVQGSPNTLSASWMVPEPTNGIISGYTINCSSSSGSVGPLTFNDSVTSIILRNLVAFTEYGCAVVATTGAGDGSFSDTMTVRTDEDCKLAVNFNRIMLEGVHFPLAVPEQPRNIVAMVNNATSITVTWMAPMTLNGVIVRYELSISSSSLGSSGLGSFNITDSSLEYNATMLSPFTEYTFEVAAVTGAGRGARVMATDTTSEDGKPFY